MKSLVDTPAKMTPSTDVTPVMMRPKRSPPLPELERVERRSLVRPSLAYGRSSSKESGVGAIGEPQSVGAEGALLGLTPARAQGLRTRVAVRLRTRIRAGSGASGFSRSTERTIGRMPDSRASRMTAARLARRRHAGLSGRHRRSGAAARPASSGASTAWQKATLRRTCPCVAPPMRVSTAANELPHRTGRPGTGPRFVVVIVRFLR